MAIRFIALGDSFQSISRHVVPEQYGIPAFSGASDVSVSSYIRVVMSVSLQKLAKLLKKIWAVFIAFDCLTHQDRSYLDVRIRSHSMGR